jgi:integrase
MSALREALQRYLSLRRSLGYKMKDEGRLLPRFVAFLEECSAAHITVRWAVQWARQTDAQPAEWARRLCFVRGFARYCSATDTLTEVPPVRLMPYHSTRAKPYLYTDDELRRLLDAAMGLPTHWPSTPLRPWVFHCLFGLLAVTGLRISEALDLELEDVDLEQAVLTIRAAKLGRTRLVPIHASTCAVLGEYLRLREAFLHQRGCSSRYVFVSNRGTRLDVGRVHRAFYALSRQVGLREVGAGKGPRLHDLRHRMAAVTLARWYASGDEPERRMPVLSTYLGHVCVAGTYWYLSGEPALMAQALARLERRWEAAS